MESRESDSASGVIKLAEFMTEERLEVFLSAFERRQDLPYSTFAWLLSQTLGILKTAKSIELLCKKIDVAEKGVIERDSFMTYLLQQLWERETRGDGLLPLQEAPSFEHNTHSKETPCRIMSGSSSQRLFSVTKDGVLCAWSAVLELQKATDIASCQSTAELNQSSKLKKMTVWVTDTAMLTSCNILVLATTSRELLFFDVSSNVYACQYKLRDLPNVPLCMTAHCTEKRSNAPAYLIYGDQDGHISVYLFHHPMTSLFVTTSSSYQDTCPVISYNKLSDHSQHVSFSLLPAVHPDWVLKVFYLPHNHCIVSCCNSPTRSLVVQELDGKMKPYIFNLSKGVSCYDFNQELDLLVTGGVDHLVRIWDPYVTSRPIATLTSHTSPVVDVLIHKARQLIFSFAQTLALCIWDVTEQCLLQMVTVKFPFSHRQPDFGTSILCCLPSPGTTATLAIACNQNIAKFKLGSSTQSNRRWGVVSHQTPVTAVLYDSGFNQVVTGCEGGEVRVWDLTTGSKVLQLNKCHGDEILTAMEFDYSGKRLLTGSHSGEIKVWDLVSGECLNRVHVPGHAEVTGMVHIPDRTMFLSAGWNRRITTFPADSDSYVVHCDQSWKGANHHKEDITCLAYSPPHYLATGSFDGDIKIWNTDLEKEITHYHTLTQCRQSPHPLQLRNSSLPSASKSTLMSCASSRPASRRMSTYHLKSSSITLQHVPVDSLVFLHSRMSDRRKGEATLVSSEGGHAQFWELLGENEAMGSFPLTRLEGEIVLALATDPTNQNLVAGDTAGNIAIFDISNYCRPHQVDEVPSPFSSWQAHDGEITSVKLAMHETQPLVLTGAADCSVRLWNFSGHFVGTFGQDNPWNLGNQLSFQHPKTPWGVVLSTESSSKLSGNLKSGSSKITTPLTHSRASIAYENHAERYRKSSAPQSASESTSSSCRSSAHSGQLPPVHGSTLGKPYKEMAKQRMAVKQVRRTNYSEIDSRSTERYGNVCSPFHALALQEVADEMLPSTLRDALQSQ